MSTILRIFIKDLRGICRNIFALIIAIGLCIIPSLYAWFNIYSNWDPYANTASIKIAVYSEDTGFDMDGIDKNESKTRFVFIWVIVLLITSKKMTNSAGHLQKIWKAQLTELKVASTTPQ